MIIRIKGNINRFLNKCINNNINILGVKYYDDYAIVTINKNDYKKIKRISYYLKIDKIKNTGLLYVRDVLLKYWYDFLMIIFFLTLIFFESNVIISVDIKHENKELKNNIKKILNNYHIKPFTIVKNNQILNEISDDILKNNRDILDFISITRNGMNLTVSLEERIMKEEPEVFPYCNIIANKDAVINQITVYKGISLVEKNQSVKKGDIIISGDLILNEEVKSQVCADGKIMGNTWYKVNIAYPKSVTEIKETGKKKYNLSINNRLLLKNKYKNYEVKTKFKLFNIKFVEIKETKQITTNYDDKTAKILAINKAKDELIKKNSGKIKIIEEKVLKENDFNSKIELELFISVEENIGTKKVGELNDPNESIQHSN